MEFNKLIYTPQLTNMVNTIYSSIQPILDTPEWVGTICSLDIIPSNGELYVIELNTNLLLIPERTCQWDFSSLVTHLTTNGYTRCIFRRHGDYFQFNENTDNLYQTLSNELSFNGIDFIQEFSMNRRLTYNKEYETDFILQHHWNFNTIDMLAVDKSSFFYHLTNNGVNVNIPRRLLAGNQSDSYDYNKETPSYFYKYPQRDAGMSAYPIVVDDTTDIFDDNFYESIESDTLSGLRVEICKRNIVGTNFILDLDKIDKEYIYYSKYEKCDEYDSEVISPDGKVLKSNFIKSNKTHIPPSSVFIEGNMLELTDGTFKDVAEITESDSIKYYKFNGFDSINYEYFLDSDNFISNYETQYTWLNQISLITDVEWKDVSLYVPIDVDIKLKVSNYVQTKVTVNNEYDFIRSRHIVFNSPITNIFKHNFVYDMQYGAEFLKKDGSIYTVTDYQETYGNFNGYSFIINEYDLYTPYFVNLNGIFVLVY